MSEEKNKTLKEITKNKYQYGFVTKIETEKFKPLVVKDLKDLSPESVYSSIKEKLELIN